MLYILFIHYSGFHNHSTNPFYLSDFRGKSLKLKKVFDDHRRENPLESSEAPPGQVEICVLLPCGLVCSSCASCSETGLWIQGTTICFSSTPASLFRQSTSWCRLKAPRGCPHYHQRVPHSSHTPAADADLLGDPDPAHSQPCPAVLSPAIPLPVTL